MPRKRSEYSRVTSTLSYLTSEWKEWWHRSKGFEECDRIRDEATTFGKKVHKAIETYLDTGNIPMKGQSKELDCALTIINWLTINYVEPYKWEVEVKDEKLKLVGHFDLLAYINTNECVLIDYKTSKKMDKSYALQLAAYAHLVKKTMGIEVNKGIILRVDKETAELEVVEYSPLKPYWAIFRAGLAFYKFMRGK